MFAIFPWLYVILSYFKQLLLNSFFVLVQKKPGLGLQSLVVEAVIFSSDNPLDFQE